jgi:hypothetical protein
MGAKVEQTDPGFQNPLETFNVRRYAGAVNALRAYGEKLREMMDPSFIETANRDAENAVLEYLEARTAFGGRRRDGSRRSPKRVVNAPVTRRRPPKG